MQKESEKTLLRRTSILLQLQAAFPAALSLETLLCGLKLSCVPNEEISKALLEADMAYLAQKGYLDETRSEICAGARRAAINAKGLDYLEISGF